MSQLNNKINALSYIKPDVFLEKELEFILKINSILLVIVLNFHITPYNTFYSFFASLPAFLYPKPALKDFYIFSIIDENLELYWKSVLISQSYHSLRLLILLPLIVNFYVV